MRQEQHHQVLLVASPVVLRDGVICGTQVSGDIPWQQLLDAVDVIMPGLDTVDVSEVNRTPLGTLITVTAASTN